jgi:hypothetical protein
VSAKKKNGKKPTPKQGETPTNGRDPVWGYLTPELFHKFLDEIENELAEARDEIMDAGHPHTDQAEHIVAGLGFLRGALSSLEDFRGRVKLQPEADEVTS